MRKWLKMVCTTVSYETNINKMARHNKIGADGEEIAAKWLVRNGFSVVERNYRRKWGEIDVIVKKKRTIHFVEVKTVSYETRSKLDYAISHETWRPEENVHPYKLKKLARAIESWLAEKRYEGKWQFDVVTVRIVPREKYGKIKYMGNLIIG